MIKESCGIVQKCILVSPNFLFMKKYPFHILFVVLVGCILISCIKKEDDTEFTPSEVVVGGNTNGTVSAEDVDTLLALNPQSMSLSNPVSITFDNASKTIQVSNPYLDNGVQVIVNNGVATIVSTTETPINYVLSGCYVGGGVKLYSNTASTITLNGLNLMSANGPAINIQTGKKTTIQVYSGTSNRLVDGRTYSETTAEDQKGTLFSEGQLCFEGTGTLKIKGNTKHAICSDDYITVKEATIQVVQAAKDAIHSNDYFEMESGSLTLNSTQDGIEVEEGYCTVSGGTIVSSCTGTAAKCIKTSGDCTLTGGDIQLNPSGSAVYNSSEGDIDAGGGIKCKGNLLISGSPSVTITSTAQAGKGISVDGTLTIESGTLQVKTSGAYYKYSTTIDAAAKAIKADGQLTINGGSIRVTTSTENAEGIESKTKLVINGGTIEVQAYDDCINAANAIEINGGSIYCYSSTNDGIDSNGTMTITGGTVVSYGSTVPEEGLDCDQNTFKVTGGTFIGIGGASSTPTSSVSTQRCLLYGVSASSLSSILHIESSAGTSVLNFKLGRSYSSSVVFCISSPALAASTTYLIYTGGSISGDTNFHGLYADASYTRGTQLNSFTTGSMVTTVGSTGGGPR